MSDSYWKQFCSDGKIDSYLKYVQNEKSYIEIIEREEEPAAEEETPTVEAEVVSD